MWELAAPYGAAAELAKSLNTSPLVAQVLANRGITDVSAARAFMTPKLGDLLPPETLPGVEQAAPIIVQAIRDGRKITIYGDYDVDGMTGLTILRACLAMAGANVDHYIPHRLQEGYGVNLQAVESVIAGGAGLLVTVDCGVSAAEPLARARAAGLDVIVTDHHSVGADLPDVSAIVHPALPGSTYGNPHLCGAGVAFKLAWQVAKLLAGRQRVDERMKDFLLESMCLAALGTIADVVPLVGENRVFATFGLRGLPAVRHVGLRALMESAGLQGQRLDAYHVGFLLAPRLNACGRMGHADLAVELLTVAPPDRARQIADYLEQQNAQRQQVERRIAEEAAEMVCRMGYDAPEHRAIVLAGRNWHAGVIGIVASRLVERFGRPTVLIALGDDGAAAQGSGRSTEGYDLLAGLTACKHVLESYGGHAMAGGVRILPQNVEAFREALAKHAAGSISPDALRRKLRLDAQATLRALSYTTVEHLGRLSPFGRGNPAPALACMGCKLLTPPKRIGQSGNTVSMLLEQDGVRMRAVGFGMGSCVEGLAGAPRVDVAAEAALNHYQGATSVELKLLDVRRAQ
jgi:single-stranded-DNA-specific exonuclease